MYVKFNANVGSITYPKLTYDNIYKAVESTMIDIDDTKYYNIFTLDNSFLGTYPTYCFNELESMCTTCIGCEITNTVSQFKSKEVESKSEQFIQFQMSRVTLDVLNKLSMDMNVDVYTLLSLGVGILKEAHRVNGTIRIFDNNNNQVYSTTKL